MVPPLVELLPRIMASQRITTTNKWKLLSHGRKSGTKKEKFKRKQQKNKSHERRPFIFYLSPSPLLSFWGSTRMHSCARRGVIRTLFPPQIKWLPEPWRTMTSRSIPRRGLSWTWPHCNHTWLRCYLCLFSLAPTTPFRSSSRLPSGAWPLLSSLSREAPRPPFAGEILPPIIVQDEVGRAGQFSPSKLTPPATSGLSSSSNLPPLSMALSGLLTLSEVAGSARVASHSPPSVNTLGSDSAIVQ